MSPIALGLDVLLIGLLLVALTVGFRLNRRLTALREGQAGFIRAVAELDAAAVRAEAGLKALKAASEDTHDELLTRIETARGLINRLEAATGEADRARAVAATAASEPVVMPEPRAQALSRLLARPEPRAAAPRPAPVRHVARELDDDLFEDAPTPRVSVGGYAR